MLDVVFLTGLLSDKTVWEHQIDALSDIATATSLDSRAASPEEMVETIIKKSPPTFYLAGHSMGGWLALEVMKKIPSRVKGLCLLNTSCAIDSPEKARLRKELIKKAENGAFSEIVDAIVEKFVSNIECKESVREMFLRVGKDTFIAQEKAMLQRNECCSHLAKISCKTYVVHAANDQNFTLQDHEELVRAIPNSKLVIVENSGHMSPMEQQEAVSQILRRWLLD